MGERAIRAGGIGTPGMKALTVTTREGLRLVGEADGDGEAPLVVLLHGGGQTRHAWAETAEALRREAFDVVRYDARGHGDSDWAIDRDYRMESHARDLRGVLGELGRPAALVGASMGGVASLIAAAEAPELAWALILVDIVPKFAPEGVERIRRFMLGHPEGFATLAEAAAAVSAYNPHRPPPQRPDGLMRSLRERGGRLYWHWDPAVIGDPPSDALTMMLSDRLAALPPSLPLLLVSGAHSDVVAPDDVEAFRRQAPQAETVVVSRAGHMVAGDHNDAFSAAICDFLQRAAPTRGR